ncbi:cytidylate kinase-like protein [Hungatella effluvii]|uniref:Cytidylate kinase-like protein n=1 Tax=Hungatella effluvii TaxID=1096246 RepID=A0A2V3XXF5_9FIRM|nr:cytidylate kinase-like family protein [Hungatella effluvii]PXX49224.1 cytidylate kinase-like protein [Hungatella effluvii]
MEYNEESLRELAEHIYDLDAEVYSQLGSSLGRVFNRDREACVEEMVRLMMTRPNGHMVRSELALIGNMARTIQDKEERKLVMTEYNKILKEVMSLPTSFASGDILDPRTAGLNTLNLKNRFSKGDHLIICIGRTYGCGGSEIGFALADALKIDYYDAEIFSAVLKRLDAEKDRVLDRDSFSKRTEQQHMAFAQPRRLTLKQRIREFSRYHGLSKRDAVFFNQSDLLCDMAKKEDFIVMGRCADVILTNNGIPHISIFITAPFEKRLQRTMEVNSSLNVKQARRLLKHLDRLHMHYYQFYTGRKWGNAGNYDLCINSASYGIDGSVDFIKRIIEEEKK